MDNFFFTVQYNGIFLLKLFGQKCFSVLFLQKTPISNVWENTFCLSDYNRTGAAKQDTLVFYSPFDSIIIIVHCLFQTRLQAGKGYKNTLHCVLTIYRKETVNWQTYWIPLRRPLPLLLCRTGLDLLVTWACKIFRIFYTDISLLMKKRSLFLNHTYTLSC